MFCITRFPETFKLPDLANSHLYKQAGNSVVVPVVNRIAQNIYKSVNNEVCINISGVLPRTLIILIIQSNIRSFKGGETPQPKRKYFRKDGFYVC